MRSRDLAEFAKRVIDDIRDTAAPEDVFTEDQLKAWARENCAPHDIFDNTAIAESCADRMSPDEVFDTSDLLDFAKSEGWMGPVEGGE